MPEYVLRNVDPGIWSRFIERANCEGWPTKPLLVALMEGYASGEFSPASPPPREIPEFAWLRAHYRQLAKEPGFVAAPPDAQWKLIIDQIIQLPLGIHCRELDAVPPAKRREVLAWLRATSDLPVPHALTLRAIAHVGSGPDLRTNRRAIIYTVLGLSVGQEAWIGDLEGGWQVLRVIDGTMKPWGGPHPTTDDAIESLARGLKTEAMAE